MHLAPIFEYELCTVPPALVDEYGCLRRGSKSPLVKRLGVVALEPNDPVTVIVDAQQILYHVVWPINGTAKDLAMPIYARLKDYRDAERILVFDKYHDNTPKDHERSYRAGDGSAEYNLELKYHTSTSRCNNEKQKEQTPSH